MITTRFITHRNYANFSKNLENYKMFAKNDKSNSQPTRPSENIRGGCDGTFPFKLDSSSTDRMISVSLIIKLSDN